MKLNFGFGDVDTLWIDGPLPVPKNENRTVKVKIAGKSGSEVPPFSENGDLMCLERPTPLQHAVTLVLSYRQSTTSLNVPPPREGVWSDVPGSPIWDQIRVALTSDAIGEIRSADGKDYSYELELNNVELLRQDAGNQPDGPFNTGLKR